MPPIMTLIVIFQNLKDLLEVIQSGLAAEKQCYKIQLSEREAFMVKSQSIPRNRILTLVFLAICCVCATSALLVGISDNPPGILLAFGGAVAFILAFVHPWRTAKQFRRLLYASLIGLVIFSILHNLFEGLAGQWAGVGVVQSMLQGIGVAAFLFAILICPPAIAVGVVGSIVIFLRNRHRPMQNRGMPAIK